MLCVSQKTPSSQRISRMFFSKREEMELNIMIQGQEKEKERKERKKAERVVNKDCRQGT